MFYVWQETFCNRKWTGRRPSGFKEYTANPLARFRDYILGLENVRYFESFDSVHRLRVVTYPTGICDVEHRVKLGSGLEEERLLFMRTKRDPSENFISAGSV